MLNRMFFAQNVSPALPISLGYGRLYNWYAASGNLAPDGWRLPTSDDFDLLRTFIGGIYSGGVLKEIGNEHWDSPNTGAVDTYLFSARGSGYRRYDDASFIGLRNSCYFWASHPLTVRTNRILEYNSDNCLFFAPNDSTYGTSIRFIKNDSVNPTTILDYDGNVYNTVTIGTQVWTASNWKCTKYNNGAVIPNVTSDSAWAALTTGAMCAYNNDENNV